MSKVLVDKFLCVALVVITTLMFVGCGLKGTIITFETWGGDEIAEKFFESNSSIWSLDIGTAQKEGYDFLAWYYDEDFSQEVIFPLVAIQKEMKFYAKYAINDNYFKCHAIYHEWGDEESYTFDQKQVENGWSFEIDKTNENYHFSQITVNSLYPVFFINRGIVVYDENGKTVKGTNESKNTFIVDEPISSSGKYVVVVYCQSTAECRIVIS